MRIELWFWRWRWWRWWWWWWWWWSCRFALLLCFLLMLLVGEWVVVLQVFVTNKGRFFRCYLDFGKSIFVFSCQWDSWGAGEVDFGYPDAGADSAALVGDLEDKTVLKQFLGTTTVDLGLWFSFAPIFCIRLVPKFAIPCHVSWSEGISWNCSVEAVLFQNSPNWTLK